MAASSFFTDRLYTRMAEDLHLGCMSDPGKRKPGAKTIADVQKPLGKTT